MSDDRIEIRDKATKDRLQWLSRIVRMSMTEIVRILVRKSTPDDFPLLGKDSKQK